MPAVVQNELSPMLQSTYRWLDHPLTINLEFVIFIVTFVEQPTYINQDVREEKWLNKNQKLIKSIFLITNRRSQNSISRFTAFDYPCFKTLLLCCS